jgi:hypothetical protein
LKFRLLVAVPFVALAAFWLVLGLVPVAEHAAVYRVEVELAKLAAFVGCAAAALRFSRGDYLRTAWLLQAQCYLLILANDVFFRAGMGLFGSESWAPLAGSIVVLVGNVGQLVGTVLIARVWRVAGFELAGSPMARRATVAGAVAVALVAGGWLIVTSAREVAHGQTASLVDLFSSVSDIISFCLIAPLVLTAIALRGGTLGWTWGLFTASLFGWLLFDATLSFAQLIAANPDAVKRVEESTRLLACGFGLSAGLMQRMAVRGARVTSLVAQAQG